MTTQCELCKTERAVMLLYALNPGTPDPYINAPRNADVFYPHQQANIAINVCVACFWDMSQSMRDEKYVAIRATGVVPNKAPYDG